MMPVAIVPDTSLSELTQAHAALKQSFRSGKLRDIPYRKQQLAQLAYLLQDNHVAFQESLARDFGKHRLEANIGETGVVFERTLDALDHLDKWLADVDLSHETNPMFSGFKPTLFKQSRGPVLIIGPFNAPILLTLQPLMGAIAAGCPAIIKPSDLTMHTSSLIYNLIHKYLDPDCYKVVMGGVDQVTALLQLKWSSICYTGGAQVGKIVALAAAKQMTHVTLELGGKCPVILDDNADIDTAARRILWGKMLNAGQVCISPDYVLTPRHIQDKFIHSLQKAWNDFFPDGALKSPDTGGIINERHFYRVLTMLQQTRGEIVIGGNADVKRRKLEVTVVKDVQPGDSLLDDEIFGPILAVVPVSDVDEALDYIESNPEPLAVYVFSQDETFKNKVRENTISGSLIYNDTFFQLNVAQLPVTGIGASGYGYQGGKYAFETFIHQRPSMDVPVEAEPHLSIRYPPYTQTTYEVLSQGLLQTKIPFPRCQDKLSNGKDLPASESEASTPSLTTGSPEI